MAAPGLQAAGTAAVDGLCEILTTATDYRVLMYGADALGEACRIPSVGVADVLISTIDKLEQMSAVSSRLSAWADGAERRQWDFAGTHIDCHSIRHAVCFETLAQLFT